MKKYQYKIVNGVKINEEEINKLGSDGWEVISTHTRIVQGTTVQIEVVLKKEVD